MSRIVAENETHRLTYASSMGMLQVLTWILLEKKDGAWVAVKRIHNEAEARNRARAVGLTLA